MNPATGKRADQRARPPAAASPELERPRRSSPQGAPSSMSAPTSDTTVHLTADLLAEVEGAICRYVVVQDHALEALALYVLHTWACDAAHTTPYVILASAEKQSGKTLLLEVLELLVRQPWRTATTSAAALYRRVHRDHPTLLLDEIDATFTGKGDTEALRGVLNAGNRRGGQATRFDAKSEDVRDFDVFCPKVLAGIDTGHVPETVRDRSITVRMHRRRGDETVERFRFRRAVEDTAELRDRLQVWAAEFTPVLADADPELPDVLGHRAAEGWEPLLAIADVAAGAWPQRARSAACALSGTPEDGQEVGHGAQLLAAIQRLVG